MINLLINDQTHQVDVAQACLDRGSSEVLAKQAQGSGPVAMRGARAVRIRG